MVYYENVWTKNIKKVTLEMTTNFLKVFKILTVIKTNTQTFSFNVLIQTITLATSF